MQEIKYLKKPFKPGNGRLSWIRCDLELFRVKELADVPSVWAKLWKALGIKYHYDQVEQILEIFFIL